MAGLNILNYEVVPNFIDTDRAVKLGDEFKQYVEQYNIEGDSQVRQSRAMYNYISFLELLIEKSNQVSSICGETVLPTYCYARAYHNGADLTRHTDRPACEVSVTLNLGSDKDWPIFVKTPEGDEVSVSLKPGDAMMYYGCVAEHWRETFEGEYCNQVFLHYVKSRGENQPFYFDKMR